MKEVVVTKYEANNGKLFDTKEEYLHLYAVTKCANVA